MIRFKKPKVEYFPVDEAFLVRAKRLIKEHHGDLRDARIAFIYRSVAAKKGDKIIYGKAQKVSKKLQSILDYDFIIEIARSSFLQFEENQKDALIEHELYHCHLEPGEEEDKPVMRDHDIEEFNAIIERYGDWYPGIKVTAMAMKSVQLPLTPAEERGKVGTLTPDVIEQIDLKEPEISPEAEEAIDSVVENAA